MNKVPFYKIKQRIIWALGRETFKTEKIDL